MILGDLGEQMKLGMLLLGYNPKTIESYTFHVVLFSSRCASRLNQ